MMRVITPVALVVLSERGGSVAGKLGRGFLRAIVVDECLTGGGGGDQCCGRQHC